MSSSDEQKVITLRLKDGTEVTLRARGNGRRTIGEVLETMDEEERELLRGLADLAATTSMIDLPEPSIADAFPDLPDPSAADAIATFGELPDPREVPLAETIPDLPEIPTEAPIPAPYTAQAGSTSACPWCGHPITLSRAPSEES